MKFLVLALGCAAAAWEERTRMEEDVTVFESSKWIPGKRVDANETLEVAFWLKHDPVDRADFEEDLMKRATPGSGIYGEWLSRDEVARRFSPSREAIDVVLDFVANDLGAREIRLSADKAAITVKASATRVEAALDTTLRHHGHKLYPKVDIVRCVKPYSLPARVARRVLVVSELVRFPSLRLPAKRTNATAVNATASEWSACGARYSAYTNPWVLASRYGFEFPKTSAAEGNSIAVAEFQEEYFDDGDLKAFSESCGLEQTVTVSKTVGGNKDSSCERGLEPCIESLLDIEYAGAIAGAIPLQVYYTTDYSLLTFTSTLSDADDPPLVVSVSYGNDEAQQTSSSFMEAVSTAFMKLGAQGITIMFASGDQGVWGREGFGMSFHPDFPAGSPYVTVVGGTDFATKSTIGEETAWTSGGSGFSDEFARPSWQDDEVNAYLDSDAADLPSNAKFNQDGRGYPDISALAGEVNPYFISYKDGSFSAVAGTSAACPVAAAMLAQINDKRLAAGKSSLGFVNPALYSAGQSAYNDVTTGVTSGAYFAGFPAAAGWDAATGWGSVKFDALAEVLVAN